MKKLIAIIGLSLFLIHHSFSQEYSNIHNGLTIKLMPFSLIEYAPRLRLGLEYKGYKRVVYGIDLGIGNTFLNRRRLDGLIWEKDYAFIEIRPEVKYVLLYTPDLYVYSAMEFFYMDLKDIFDSGYYEKENSNVETTFDSAKFNKQKYGLHLKAGMNIIAYKRLNFDFYGGIGFAKRIFSYTDVVNPIEGTHPVYSSYAPQPYLYEGESIIVHISLGLKIGYTLYKK